MLISLKVLQQKQNSIARILHSKIVMPSVLGQYFAPHLAIMKYLNRQTQMGNPQVIPPKIMAAW